MDRNKETLTQILSTTRRKEDNRNPYYRRNGDNLTKEERIFHPQHTKWKNIMARGDSSDKSTDRRKVLSNATLWYSINMELSEINRNGNKDWLTTGLS